MNSGLELYWEEVERLVNFIYHKHEQDLSDAEKLVLQASYEDETYGKMAKGSHYKADYLNSTAAPRLWQILTKELGETVGKKNCIRLLMEYKKKQASLESSIDIPLKASLLKATLTSMQTVNNLESSEGQVPLNSHFYIERHNVESLCYEAIKHPGALIRIRSPQKMGKSSVLERILVEVAKQHYEFVRLSFETDQTVFSSLHKFTRYFCACVSKQLKMDNQLDKYWDDIYGCNDSATTYFEEYLLVGRSKPLILALDDVDFVFEQPEIANDFCRLLKTWYNLARRSGDRGAIWKKLRLIVVHSTDVYSSLDINYSPLNGVGQVVPLEEFSREEVIELTRRYKFNFVATEIEQLMNLVGGHPYLLRLALDYLKSHGDSLAELLQVAPKEASPFRTHLQKCLEKLLQHPELATALLRVVKAGKPVELRSNEAFKLQRLGLVKMQDDNWISSCNLYSQYFPPQL